MTVPENFSRIMSPTAAGLFIAPSIEFSTLRLGCWQAGPLTTKGAMQARLTVAGVEFTPLEIK